MDGYITKIRNKAHMTHAYNLTTTTMTTHEHECGHNNTYITTNMCMHAHVHKHTTIRTHREHALRVYLQGHKMNMHL